MLVRGPLQQRWPTGLLANPGNSLVRCAGRALDRGVQRSFSVSQSSLSICSALSADHLLMGTRFRSALLGSKADIERHARSAQLSHETNRLTGVVVTTKCSHLETRITGGGLGQPLSHYSPNQSNRFCLTPQSLRPPPVIWMDCF